VLDAVEKLGLRDNTIIVFWSDHGYHLGEHGLFFKQSCFENAARVPMIIATPGTKNAGKTCRQLVELLDLYPTLADLTGATPPSHLDGQTLRGLLEQPDIIWDRPAFTQVDRPHDVPGHSVRTPKWRYTEWDFGDKGVELYDEDADPQELHNLASDASHADAVKELKAMLKTVHPTKVTGGVAEKDTRKKWCD
jgi:arylsulfatase A-like enzyme